MYDEHGNNKQEFIVITVQCAHECGASALDAGGV